jgi:hypothetical protein
MPCSVPYTRFIFLESFSYVLQFDMHFYMCSNVDKNFILVKSGCYTCRFKVKGKFAPRYVETFKIVDCKRKAAQEMLASPRGTAAHGRA